MSKELIESLRYLANRPPYSGAADIMLRAADALEAKAAPVGERETFEEWLLTTGIPLTDTNPYALASWDAWKASAAHQRQQARAALMPKRKPLPELMMAEWHEVKGWNACLDEFARLNKGGSHE